MTITVPLMSQEWVACPKTVVCQACGKPCCIALSCERHVAFSASLDAHYMATKHSKYIDPETGEVLDKPFPPSQSIPPASVSTATKLVHCTAPVMCSTCNKLFCRDTRCPLHILADEDWTTHRNTVVGHTRYTPVKIPVTGPKPRPPAKAESPIITTTWDCHKGNCKIFEVMTGVETGLVVYGGGSSHRADPGAVDIVIALASSSSHDRWSVPASWRLAKHVPLVAQLPFPDYQAPPMSREMWRALWKDLLTEAKKSAKLLTVLVMCVGGHGRTGTALVALAHEAGVIPLGADPIVWLREVYCDKAVEAKSQIQYLEAMYGFTTAAKSEAITYSYSAGGKGGPSANEPAFGDGAWGWD